MGGKLLKTVKERWEKDKSGLTYLCVAKITKVDLWLMEKALSWLVFLSLIILTHAVGVFLFDNFNLLNFLWITVILTEIFLIKIIIIIIYHW